MRDGLERYRTAIQNCAPWRWKGSVVESIGQTIESAGPLASVGECCRVVDRLGLAHEAEVIGFRGSHVVSMPIETTDGIRLGDIVEPTGDGPRCGVGAELLGRVLDASGNPIDGGLTPPRSKSLPLHGAARAPLARLPIRETLTTGIRAIDGLLSVGRGQRLGIFGGSGVGKSTLIGMMTRNTEADITVVGLVGERGREVGEFLEDAIGSAGRARSVVVVSTSDQSPLRRLRAPLLATTIAEYFAEQGKNVLLVLDSLTRFAMAAREIGLAAGEPPTAKGYTPSVFTRLANLIERAGNFENGSITAFYTVLMEGDDLQDPIVDAARSLLDGHIVLSRQLSAEGWYPPIDVLGSISRLMPSLISATHGRNASLVRQLMAASARSEDLVRIGAYKPGADPDLDRALRARNQIRDFLVQTSTESGSSAETLRRLDRLAGEI